MAPIPPSDGPSDHQMREILSAPAPVVPYRPSGAHAERWRSVWSGACRCLRPPRKTLYHELLHRSPLLHSRGACRHRCPEPQRCAHVSASQLRAFPSPGRNGICRLSCSPSSALGSRERAHLGRPNPTGRIGLGGGKLGTCQQAAEWNHRGCRRHGGKRPAHTFTTPSPRGLPEQSLPLAAEEDAQCGYTDFVESRSARTLLRSVLARASQHTPKGERFLPCRYPPLANDLESV